MADAVETGYGNWRQVGFIKTEDKWSLLSSLGLLSLLGINGDAVETVRDSWRLVEIRWAFEIQMPKAKVQTKFKCQNPNAKQSPNA